MKKFIEYYNERRPSDLRMDRPKFPQGEDRVILMAQGLKNLLKDPDQSEKILSVMEENPELFNKLNNILDDFLVLYPRLLDKHDVDQLKGLIKPVS